MHKKMRKSVLFVFLSAIISGLVLVSPVCFSLAQTSTSFTISGYILDSDGNGINGAHIAFYLPSNLASGIPTVISDSSGYYVVSAPNGTYNLNVWPPFDSNYIHYDEQGFVVESDLTKNMTLPIGLKVSGYVSDSSGNPVSNAAVLLDEFGSGWFSNTLGYYFVNVPAGTYDLTVKPRYGDDHFSRYFESNLTINGETTKNITVSDHSTTQSPTPNEPSPEPSPTQNSTSFTISGYILDSDGHGIADAMIIFSVPQIVPAVYSDSSGYYVTYAPAGTYHVRVWPPFDSNFLSFDQQSLLWELPIFQKILH